ncbi:hypothetical protein AVEN_111552-1 [Araneus ventricosus]|uniref:Uncharacterized protein n=1 Tax=Araneus ventricosus TaxID=182803 RepID=A0A4Y2S2R9_ARAVE|nr:hypothetical protein AVEN_23210-1 [Araneus ventricosus]GBN82413.1 hypothetical protein AVEN_111552-1 [Araneus ventricosus]
MYCSFQNETNPLPKLWIRISDSESVIPNPRNQSESNSDSQIRFRGFIMNPIRRIRSFWSESDPVVAFEDPDPRIRSGVDDSSLECIAESLVNRSTFSLSSLLIPVFQLILCQRLQCLQ